MIRNEIRERHKVIGVKDEDEIEADIEMSQSKKICGFCFNPFAVIEMGKLLVCENCYSKIKSLRTEIKWIIDSKPSEQHMELKKSSV